MLNPFYKKADGLTTKSSLNMKIRLLFFALIILSSSSFAFVLRDSVHVIRKEVKIENGKTGEDKRELKIVYPILEGDISPEILKKINKKCNFEKVWGMSVERMKADFLKANGNGDDFPDIDFYVSYNKNNILAIGFGSLLPGQAYYGDGSSFIINLLTGEELKITDILSEDSFNDLVKLINEQMQQEITDGEKEGSVEKGRFAGTTFSKDELKSFTISKEGIYFNYGLRTGQLWNRNVESWGYLMDFGNKENLKKYIKPNGLLGNVIK